MPTTLLLLGLGWTLALNVFRRPLEATQLLAQGFDVAFVGGILPLSFFEQLEHFIHLLEGLAQRRDHFHHIVDTFANGVLLGRAEIARGRWGLGLAALVSFLTRRQRSGRARFNRGGRSRLFRRFHIRRGGKESLLTAGHLADILGLGFGRVGSVAFVRGHFAGGFVGVGFVILFRRARGGIRRRRRFTRGSGARSTTATAAAAASTGTAAAGCRRTLGRRRGRC